MSNSKFEIALRCSTRLNVAFRDISVIEVDKEMPLGAVHAGNFLYYVDENDKVQVLPGSNVESSSVMARGKSEVGISVHGEPYDVFIGDRNNLIALKRGDPVPEKSIFGKDILRNVSSSIIVLSTFGHHYAIIDTGIRSRGSVAHSSLIHLDGAYKRVSPNNVIDNKLLLPNDKGAYTLTHEGFVRC